MAHSLVHQRLVELGRPLPTPAAPLASYVPAIRTGNLIFTAGQLPLVDGKLHAAGLVSADAEDGVIEAVELPEKRFAIGVQWHPECLPEEPAMQRLFSEFVNAALE